MIISPILFVDLLKQAGYKNAVLLSMMHKQKTYFSKKYSKSNRITLLGLPTNNLTNICNKDTIKTIKHIDKQIKISVSMIAKHFRRFDKIKRLTLSHDRNNLIRLCVMKNNIKIVRYFVNNGCCSSCKCVRKPCEYNYSFICCIKDKHLLPHCAGNENIKMAKLLIDKGANIDIER